LIGNTETTKQNVSYIDGTSKRKCIHRTS